MLAVQNRVPDSERRNDWTAALAATIHALAKIGTVADVIVGSEPGVELADQLSAALGLRSNGLEQSATRRNKFEQSEETDLEFQWSNGDATKSTSAAVLNLLIWPDTVPYLTFSYSPLPPSSSSLPPPPAPPSRLLNLPPAF